MSENAANAPTEVEIPAHTTAIETSNSNKDAPASDDGLPSSPPKRPGLTQAASSAVSSSGSVKRFSSATITKKFLQNRTAASTSNTNSSTSTAPTSPTPPPTCTCPRSFLLIILCYNSHWCCSYSYFIYDSRWYYHFRCLKASKPGPPSSAGSRLVTTKLTQTATSASNGSKWAKDTPAKPKSPTAESAKANSLRTPTSKGPTSSKNKQSSSGGGNGKRGWDSVPTKLAKVNAKVQSDFPTAAEIKGELPMKPVCNLYNLIFNIFAYRPEG